ncbi:hypothetical protein FF2_024800 [Malus domestica]
MGICLGVGKWWEAGWEESNGSSGLSGREDDGAGSLRVGIHLARGKVRVHVLEFANLGWDVYGSCHFYFR